MVFGIELDCPVIIREAIKLSGEIQKKIYFLHASDFLFVNIYTNFSVGRKKEKDTVSQKRRGFGYRTSQIIFEIYSKLQIALRFDDDFT